MCPHGRASPSLELQLNSTGKSDFDCVVCGSCVVDLPVWPVPLDEAWGADRLVDVQPIVPTVGGIVSNAGVALSRLGMRCAAFTILGNDPWAPVVRSQLQKEGIDCTHVLTHAATGTSVTVALIDDTGRRSFIHCAGAHRLLDKAAYLSNLDLFSRSRAMLMGYYSLLPNLENDLVEVFETIRRTGCMTALDAAGAGGGMQPLEKLLPYLDFYVPSFKEAQHQTGETDPQRIIARYRACGAAGVLGVKLGSRGALLSDKAGEYVQIEAVDPPGKVVDTTGAGDVFYAGLIAGLLKRLSLREAGRLAAACSSYCITAPGATTALRNWDETAQLAGISVENP